MPPPLPAHGSRKAVPALRSQFVTLKRGEHLKYARYVFTGSERDCNWVKYRLLRGIMSWSGCGDKLCLRLRRIEQAVTARGSNSRPVGNPGTDPGPEGTPHAAQQRRLGTPGSVPRFAASRSAKFREWQSQGSAEKAAGFTASLGHAAQAENAEEYDRQVLTVGALLEAWRDPLQSGHRTWQISAT